MASRLPPDGLDPISTTLPDGYYVVQKSGTRFRKWYRLVASTNITLTVDDPNQELEISATLSTTKTINAQTGTSYTLVLGDAGAFVTMNNGSASTLTVPPNSSVAFPVGTVIEGAQLGTGQVTLTAGVGVTINASPGLKIATRYGSYGLIKTATDTWLAYGRLAA